MSQWRQSWQTRKERQKVFDLRLERMLKQISSSLVQVFLQLQSSYLVLLRCKVMVALRAIPSFKPVMKTYSQLVTSFPILTGSMVSEQGQNIGMSLKIKEAMQLSTCLANWYPTARFPSFGHANTISVFNTVAMVMMLHRFTLKGMWWRISSQLTTSMITTRLWLWQLREMAQCLSAWRLCNRVSCPRLQLSRMDRRQSRLLRKKSNKTWVVANASVPTAAAKSL